LTKTFKLFIFNKIVDDKMNYFEMKEIHCVVDNLVFKVCKNILPHVSKYLSESDLNVISTIINFIIGYCINMNIKIIPGILFFISYFINVLHHFHVQKIQEKYIIDNIWNIISYIFILNTIYKKDIKTFIIIFTLFVPTIFNWGCQIKYIKKKYPEYNKEISIFNETCSILCPFSKQIYDGIYNDLKIGNGTLTLIISIYLMFL
jgi:hypothetical protein